MGRKVRRNYRRIVLRLADLDHTKAAVLNGLTAPTSRRVYEFAIEEFIAWCCSEPRLALNRMVVIRYRIALEGRGLAAATINQRLAAIRRASLAFSGVVESRQDEKMKKEEKEEAIGCIVLATQGAKMEILAKICRISLTSGVDFTLSQGD